MKSNFLIFEEEFGNELKQKYYYELNGLMTSLQLSGSLAITTQGWVKEQVARKIADNKNVKELSDKEKERWWKAQKKAKEIENLEKRQEYLASINIDDETLEKLSCINAKCKLWSENTWEKYTSQIFLDKKDSFDEATFKILRIPISENKKISELYHRIKAKEQTFESIAEKHGQGSERMRGGCIKKTRLNIPQPKLIEQIRNRKPGELIMPFKLNEWYIIIEIIELKAAEMNKDIKEQLISEAFNSFLTYTCNKLIKSYFETTHAKS